MFLRNDSLKINESFESSFYSFPKALDLEILTNMALKSLSPKELFLTNGFKVIFSQDFANFVTDWFAQKLMVVYRADSMQILKRFSDPQKNSFYIEKTTNEAAKLFGISSNAIGYVVEEDDAKAKLFSIKLKIINIKLFKLKYLNHLVHYVLLRCFLL